MKSQFLILLLIPILLIPTVSGQIESELEKLKQEYQTLQDNYDRINAVLIQKSLDVTDLTDRETKHSKIISILWERVGEKNFENTQLEKKLTVIPELNQYIRDLKIMVEDRDDEILLLKTEINNTKIIVTPQQDEVVKQELTEFSDPKILKQKIKLHNELISLKSELFKFEKIHYDEVAKSNYIKHGEPISEFEFSWYGGLDLPVLGEYSFPLHIWEERKESTIEDIEGIKKYHKQWKENQESERLEKLEKEKLEKELDKLFQLKDEVNDYYTSLDGYNSHRGIPTTSYDHYRLSFHTLPDSSYFRYSLIPPSEWNQAGVNNPEYKTSSNTVITNSDGEIIHTYKEPPAWRTINSFDLTGLPFGKYKVEIDFERVDKKYPGKMERYFYYSPSLPSMELLSSAVIAEHIKHEQAKMQILKDEFPKH